MKTQYFSTDLVQGFYRLSDKHYHQIDAVSGSFLKRCLKSPLHSQIEIEQTKAMRFGSNAHMAIFENAEYQARKIIEAAIDRRTTTGKEQAAQLEKYMSENPQNFLISRLDDEKIRAMRTTLGEEKLNLIEMCSNGGDCEKVLVWDLPKSMCEAYDLPHNVKCKAKLDMMIKPELSSTGKLTIIEYKTTQDADSSQFGREIAKRRYHLSAAWYVWGLSIVTGVPMHDIDFIFWPQESEAPFDWSQYLAEPEMLQRGWERADQAMKKLSIGIKSDFKMGLSKELQTISLPLFELNALET